MRFAAGQAALRVAGFAVLLVGCSAFWTPAARAEPVCRVALALGLDISSSVNAREYRLQLDGLAYALTTDAVIEAILSPKGTAIAAAAYEWSGYQQQDVIIDWQMLDSEEAIRAFAARLRAHKRRYAEFPTAIGKAVQFGAKLLRRGPSCGRYVIDLSGDGENNDGVGPGYFREQGQLDGLIINGLVIQGAYPNPAIYYREHVMQGPESFVALARDFEDYRLVMVGKLMREVGAEMIVGDNRSTLP